MAKVSRLWMALFYNRDFTDFINVKYLYFSLKAFC